ncbi:probable ribosome production factor 1 [Zootermopsis nevadensis]|uniref:Putative ribosome production factor 1 n=1 Tax=Zootermopsis nevadensis TaxID=136037 RepID=A0A067QIZ0_ZOONE|nr:probable ribosome production factor 1 [Zootermopsis nevadensis]KDR07446.1 putative ribosome production factor 1 [Zootermopsis nevadensis]
MDSLEAELIHNEKEINLVDLKSANQIRNKTLRRAQVLKDKRLKSKLKKEERKKKNDSGTQKNVPKTIDSMREKDHTMLVYMDEEDQLELNLELDRDELSSYFQKTYEPKVLITFSDNPHQKCRIFGRELTRIIPNSVSLYRSRSGVKKMVQSAIGKGFTDIIVINEDRCQPNGLLVIHLPEGPTAHFRLSNVKLTPELKRNYKEISEHRPEVILNNFNTHLGNTVSRMLAALFHYEPEFKGRRAVTFHNQRDYIFFRHHRYEFTSNGKAKLRELGPRFTLKLRSLQHGTFDSKTGDYEWIITDKRHDLETSRRRFYL